jgi:hypothetical protein
MASSSKPSRKRGSEDDDDKSRRCRLIKEGTTSASKEAPLPPKEPDEVPAPRPRRHERRRPWRSPLLLNYML